MNNTSNTQNTEKKRFSVNAKLNAVLTEIFADLEEMGKNEVKRYMQNFKHESDYNIVQYGNMIIYYEDVRAMYERAGYKGLKNWSNSKIWETYKRQVGYMARVYMNY